MQFPRRIVYIIAEYCNNGPIRELIYANVVHMSISQQPSQELDTLVTITEILTGPLQFLDKCESVLQVLADFTGSELVALRELDPENFTLTPIASYNRLDPPNLPISHSLPSWTDNVCS